MITLRQKLIGSDRTSLYLDFYPPIDNGKGGKTRREFLGLYLVDHPVTATDKAHNREVMRQADDRLTDRERAVSKGLRSVLFMDYLSELAAKHIGTSRDGFDTMAKYLNDYAPHIRFDDLDERFCDGFRTHLLGSASRRSTGHRLSHNSASNYYGKFLTVLRQAGCDGLIPNDLADRTTQIPTVETRRDYVTIDELNRLASAPCGDSVLKRASLFSALTGIRFSDIEKMTWSEVEHTDDQGHTVRFTQRKTGGVETMPVSDQARGLMGDRGESKARVFDGLVYSVQSNRVLSAWVRSAGITKHITFHCFRHTFATLQLSLGTDIFTVSKMLGHRNLRTTQVYANIMDGAKRDACNRIVLSGSQHIG